MEQRSASLPNWAISTGSSQPLERLQKFLARAGVASRRHAEALMRDGRVLVNGKPATEPGTKVRPDVDEVRVDGRLVCPPASRIYLALYKPPGVVTTARDPQGRKTVLDLLPSDLRVQRLFPVGRLDLESEGLLLLTNDGDFALHLTHPRYEQEKEYHALVAGHPAPAVLAQLRRGVHLPGETCPTAPAQARLLRPGAGDTHWLSVILHEGRKRQVRRMLAVVGHPVLRLVRVRIGALWLGDLQPGQWRRVTEKEVARLLG